MQKHIKDSGHKYCGCGGYHYKHRLGSPCCEGNPLSALYLAMRCAELTDDEILDLTIDLLWDAPVKANQSQDCPF